MGNTALKAALSEGITLGKTFRYQGEKKIAFIQSLISKEQPDIVVIASVVEISAQDERALKAACPRVVIADPVRRSPMQKYGVPDSLPADRAASLIAGRHLFRGRPLTVVDLGTTLTVDLCDAEGRYEGGNISLGYMTRFKALHRYAKSLPSVTPPSSVDVFGCDTVSSIESGVVSGIMFELQGYAGLRPDNLMIFTGGDANYFAEKMKNSIFVVCNLVLIGLALITIDYDKENFK